MSLLDDMVKTVEQPGDQIIDEAGEQFSKKIKEYAQRFATLYREDQKTLKDWEKHLEKQKEAVRGIQKGQVKSSYEWRILSENRAFMTKTDHYREMTTAALDFQAQINELLDQTVELIYVYQDEKNNPKLYTMKESDLYPALSYEINKGSIGGKFDQTKAAFANFLGEKDNVKELALNEKFNLDYYNYTYKEVIWRFNYGHNKGTDLILWLNPDGRPTKWLKASVNKQGDIKEAYASVLLDPDLNSVKLFNDAKLDNNVHMFMEEVAKVDSESGLLKGDVTVGKIEYAIKGMKASTLGLHQIITLAQKIVQQTTYTKQNLIQQKEEFHKKAGARNQIEKMLEKQLKSFIGEVGKQFTRAIEHKNRMDMSVLINLQPDNIKGILQQ